MPPLSAPEVRRAGWLLLLASLLPLISALATAEPSPPPPMPDRAGACGGEAELLAGGRIDVNRVSAATLAVIPGVGPGLAGRIVADRAARGPFGSAAELDRVPGIGAVRAGEIGAWVCFERR